MSVRKLLLEINSELFSQDGQPLDENDPRLKVMIEAARQLGLYLKGNNYDKKSF
jgi:hypothetical protein